MSTVQTTYPNYHEAYAQGQIADTSTCRIDSVSLVGAADVPFGYAVRRDDSGSARRGQLGALRRQIALLSAAVNATATAATVDNIEGGELPAGIHVVIDTEILYVSAVASGALTVVRGAMATTPAAHADNAPVRALNDLDFLGVSVEDQRLPAANGAVYKTGDIMSVLSGATSRSRSRRRSRSTTRRP